MIPGGNLQLISFLSFQSHTWFGPSFLALEETAIHFLLLLSNMLCWRNIKWSYWKYSYITENISNILMIWSIYFCPNYPYKYSIIDLLETMDSFQKEMLFFLNKQVKRKYQFYYQSETWLPAFSQNNTKNAMEQIH